MAKKLAKKSAGKSAKKKVVKKITKKAAKKPAKKKVVKSTRPARKPASVKPAAPVFKRSRTVNAYLTFNGNCEEAFNFYKSVFGGQFASLERFNRTPPSAGIPMDPSEGEKIMHVALPISRETMLMGSDTTAASGQVSSGGNFSISVDAVSKEEAERYFNGLSAGGKIIMPLASVYWGTYFGMLKDKFGIQWMVSFDPNRKD